MLGLCGHWFAQSHYPAAQGRIAGSVVSSIRDKTFPLNAGWCVLKASQAARAECLSSDVILWASSIQAPNGVVV